MKKRSQNCTRRKLLTASLLLALPACTTVSKQSDSGCNAELIKLAIASCAYASAAERVPAPPAVAGSIATPSEQVELSNWISEAEQMNWRNVDKRRYTAKCIDQVLQDY